MMAATKLVLVAIGLAWLALEAEALARPLSRRSLVIDGAAATSVIGVSLYPPPSRAAADATLEPGPPGLRLTRADLSRKLSRLPVFYVKATSGAPVLDGAGEGKFYLSSADAEAALAASGAKGAEVSFVFLNEVWFPLITKMAKLDIFPPNSMVGKTAAAGLAEKPFVIVPDSTEVENGKRRGGVLGSGTLGEGAQVPLFLVERISFAGANPGEFIKPMFLSEADAVGAYGQMLAEKKKQARGAKVDLPEEPAISVITLNSFINGAVIGNVAGSKRLSGEAKVLELFPSAQSVADAQKITADGYLR